MPDPSQIQDVQGYDKQEKSAVMYPDGLSETWLIEKSKHLNKAFEEWFNPKYLKNIEENYRLYEGKKISGALPGGTNIPVPTSVIDTASARLAGVVLGREKFVEAIPTDPQVILDADDKNNTVEDFINESLGMTPDITDKCDEILKTAMLESLGVAFPKWVVEEVVTSNVNRDMNQDGQALAIQISQQTSMRGYADFEPESLMALAWDPRCKDKLEHSSWLRRRKMVSANDLLKMEQEGVIQNAQYAIEHAPKRKGEQAGTAQEAMGEMDPDARRSKSIEEVNLPAIDYDDSIYELDEFWATLTWKQGEIWQRGEYQYWVVGGVCVVMFRENPLEPKRKPVVTWKISRKPGMLLGQCPMDTIKDMARDLQTTMARKNRILTRAANNPTYYEPSSGLDAKRTILQEASLIPVLSIAGIKEAEVPINALGVVAQSAEFLIGQMRDATASNDQAQGISSEGDTATEANILAAGANIRFQYTADGFLNNIMAPLAQEYYLLYKQFGQEGQMVVREAGMDGTAKAVPLEDLMTNYKFKAIPSQGTQQKLKKFELGSALLEKLAMLPPGVLTDAAGIPQKVNTYEFLKTQLLPLIDIKASGLFVPAAIPSIMMGASGIPGQEAPMAPGMDAQPMPEQALTV